MAATAASTRARICAMEPFVAAQMQALIEDIRLLEAFVTAPLGLYADLRMLRESMELPEAADLSLEENQRRRLAYRRLTDDPPPVAHQTIEHIGTTLDILERVKDGNGAPLNSEWVARARQVVARAEQRVAGDLRSETLSRLRGLYVIVDPEATRGRPVLGVAEAALKGGASVVQLRDKVNESGKVLEVARQLKSTCEEHDALFIVNDDPGLALFSGAHGVHLGQTDIPASEARRVLKPSQIVGLSNNSMDEVARSQAQGADYLAVGAVFGTATMGKGARPVVGVEIVRKVKSVASQPIVAIGGIDQDNVAEVVSAGADCVCVVSAVTLAEDPEAAAAALVKAIQNVKTP